MKNPLKLLAITLSVIVLFGGCFPASVEFNIYDDGSGELSTEVFAELDLIPLLTGLSFEYLSIDNNNSDIKYRTNKYERTYEKRERMFYSRKKTKKNITRNIGRKNSRNTVKK